MATMTHSIEAAEVSLSRQAIREWRARNPMERLNLRAANLCEADLHGVDLRRADLRAANLCVADLYGANLYRADLREANLHRANLRRADLHGADLHGANLCGTDLRGANNILVGSGDGWIFFANRHVDGLRIHAGCHWFTVAEAKAHWNGDSLHDRISLLAVRQFVEQAKLRGWELG